MTPFGVDLGKFHPGDASGENNVFTFGIVKKLEYKYGIDILIRAFHALCQEHPHTEWQLVIYGRGSAEPAFRKLAAEYGDPVLFQGFIPNGEVPDAMREMDAACFPSIMDSESFGVAAVEAMACGIPVIASDASGFTEVVTHGEQGLLVPKNDVEALKDAMYQMYSFSAERRREMGRQGVARVEERYNVATNMDTYEQALKEVAGLA